MESKTLQNTVTDILNAKYDLEKIVFTAIENFRDRTGLIPKIEVYEKSSQTGEGEWKRIYVNVIVEL